MSAPTAERVKILQTIDAATNNRRHLVNAFNFYVGFTINVGYIGGFTSARPHW